jgi:hypothetical protein
MLYTKLSKVWEEKPLPTDKDAVAFLYWIEVEVEMAGASWKACRGIY